MADEPSSILSEEPPAPASSRSGLHIALLVIAALYVAASLYLLFDMHGRTSKLEARQAAGDASVAELTKQLSSTRSELKADSAALAEKVGLTQKELETRSAALRREQYSTAARLERQQKEGFSSVAGEVAGVKTEVGGVKTDVATTKADLESTKMKLERAIGDLGLQSGLIAHTREELEYLKHRGDRNYYEFTLTKSSRPSPVGTISLQLKKVDAKKGKFTLSVLADDRTIEKKDRNVNEPIQFYSGRDRQLFELVVFTAEKQKVSGYLSTPKGAPEPPVAR